MTIEEAFAQLLGTSAYADVAKEKNALGGKYRVYRGRFKKGALKRGAMVEILLEHDYKITVKK